MYFVVIAGLLRDDCRLNEQITVHPLRLSNNGGKFMVVVRCEQVDQRSTSQPWDGRDPELDLQVHLV